MCPPQARTALDEVGVNVMETSVQLSPAYEPFSRYDETLLIVPFQIEKDPGICVISSPPPGMPFAPLVTLGSVGMGNRDGPVQSGTPLQASAVVSVRL